MNESIYHDFRQVFEKIHNQYDDRLVDAAAKAAGLRSGIGRMSHLTDDVLEQIVRDQNISESTRVLDLGSGRGFLARWFEWRGLRPQYVGLEASRAAIEASRLFAPNATFIQGDFLGGLPEGAFDVVFAIEIDCVGYIDRLLAEALLRPLSNEGVTIVTIASFRGGFDEAVRASVDTIREVGGHATVKDVTSAVRPFAKAFSQNMLASRDAPDMLSKLAFEECSRILQALNTNEYGYAIIEVRRTP